MAEEEMFSGSIIGRGILSFYLLTCNFNEKLLKCRDPGSNRGPLDLQSNALPTELSRLIQNLRKVQYLNHLT